MDDHGYEDLTVTLKRKDLKLPELPIERDNIRKDTPVKPTKNRSAEPRRRASKTKNIIICVCTLVMIVVVVIACGAAYLWYTDSTLLGT